MLKKPFICEAEWQGYQFQGRWAGGSSAFIPASSHLSFVASNPHSETAIRLKHSLFEVAARDHVDFGQIDFSFHDVSSPATWQFGMALACIVRDAEYQHWPLLVESAAVSLTLAVIREISPEATKAFRPVQHGFSEARRRRVRDYIEANITRPITLVELASVANLSVYHFCRQFKNEMGVTPQRYLATRRIEMAMRMLRSSADPLVAVSLSCGFSSQSHFSTLFKKVTGVTPATYRDSGL